MRHLPEVVRTRLDTWYPSHLPARFRPPAQPRSSRLLRPLPLALAALLLVLLAAGAAAGPTRVLTGALVNLAGSHPSPTPTPRPRSDASSSSGQVRPAAATIVVTPIPANPAALAGPAAIRGPQAASSSRTMAPPAPTSGALAIGSPIPSAAPPLPDTNPNGSQAQGPSPTPSPVPSAEPGSVSS